MPSSARLSRPPIAARAAGRYAAAGAAQASRRVEPARRSVLALCDRQFAPHQARRAARRRTAGRSLYRADRRAAVAARFWPKPAASAAAQAAIDRRAGSAPIAAAAAGHRGRSRSPSRLRRDAGRQADLDANYLRRRAGTSTVMRGATKQAGRFGTVSRCVGNGLQLRGWPAGASAACARPCSGDTGRRNRPDRASAAGSRRRGPRWR